MGNKVASASETRLIEVGLVDDNDRKKHNKIKTSKYTFLMFVPKNLAEQFRRVANFYFLLVTVIAVVIDSPVSPYTSIAPLSFMVLVTAMKQGYEDWLRHKNDNKVNNQIVEIVYKGVVKEVKNSTIAPGTLVRVKRGVAVPADLVLLCSAGEQGKCFVTTANLDGETNLKTLRVPPPLVGYSPDILPQGMKIEVPHPEADLYTFYGRIEIPGHSSLAVTTDNLMLRGSRVKNTEWAIGCAVYTGEETKLALNSKYSGNKFSSCELAINGFLVCFIFLLILEMCVSLAFKIIIERSGPGHEVYLGPGTPQPAPFSSLMQDLFSFLLLYYYIIPMSLYVTIELYKFVGALFIGWDQELCCEETGRPALANTSDLNEELGQVEVLFSDKTGTLTKNLMVFKTCSVKGVVYEERDGRLYDMERLHDPVDIGQTDIKFFFTILALCHSVQISSEEMRKLSARLSANFQLKSFFKKKTKKSAPNGTTTVTIDGETLNNIMQENKCHIEYQASSPDEKALVEVAARAGATFLGEDGNTMLVKVGEFTEMYERLQVIEFTSERKRMSVIVRDKDGKIWLFCKGAENAVFPLCKNAAMVDTIERDIDFFANRGLRTLAVAYRQVSDEDYENITRAINQLDGKSAEALQQVTQQYRVLENNLTLLGATGVEDCLQDDVADTLAALKRAGIRIWVLTGDKVETAINVAKSCNHMSENDRQLTILNVCDEESLQAHLAECNSIARETSYRDMTLVVDGTSMSQILDTKYVPIFVDISLKCNAVLCCRLSPIQKAEIVKIIKNSPEHPVTAAMGDGANDISMIQEAHVGIGIFGREGHQAARSADFAFTKFSSIKKVLLVMGHWYYQRLATLIHYFFYKNLVLGNLMLFFQTYSHFSTQSMFDSMYLTCFNLFFTSVPCFILSVTEQRWPSSLLVQNPTLYREIRKNRLMGWRHFVAWCCSSVYHSLLIFFFTVLFVQSSVVSTDGKNLDLWMFGAVQFHMMVVVTNLKLWLQARYQTFILIASIVLSIILYVAFNTFYSAVYLQVDGDVLGTYLRLLSSFSFWMLNLLLIVACFIPDYLLRLMSDKWGRQWRSRDNIRTIFTTRL
ncbi:hypothetical protein O0L34_g2178 [Tuta absoluta]|nr:hypothetical protein O0L34_g2178 [Tuta absoluta]